MENHPFYSIAAMLNRAGYHLMGQTNIWYDRVPNERGDMVHGPEYQAVITLCKLASDLRAEAARAL